MIKLVLKEILHELREIRKELQAIRSSMEFNPKITIDSQRIAENISRIQVQADQRLPGRLLQPEQSEQQSSQRHSQ